MSITPSNPFNSLQFADIQFNATQTPVSQQFDDIYFSTQDGLAESQYVFQAGNDLWRKWLAHSQTAFIIAETGFGTGLNFLAVAEKFTEFRTAYPAHPLQALYFLSFEKFPLKADQFGEIHRTFAQFADNVAKLTACWQPHQTGCQRYHFGTPQAAIYLDIWFGDLHDNLPQLGDDYHGLIDCWFLDGFSPDKNPEMWAAPLYQAMFRLTKNGGSFATFTAASAVRKGLQAVGFEVKKRKGFGKKREMLWGEKPQNSAASACQFPYFAPYSAPNIDEVAIVGGGVASLFLAWSLLEKGKKVTLYCEDGELAGNASGNPQGAIYPQLSDDDPRNIRFYVHSVDYALHRLQQLAQAVDFEHAFTGVALYAYNEKTAQKLDKIAEQGWDLSLFQRLNAENLSEKIGLKVPNGGAFIAQGGWLSPVQLVRNGFAYLQKLGLKIELNHQVSDISWQAENGQSGWQWTHNGHIFRHQALVLANGHQLKAFAQTDGIPLYPVRGQVSQVRTNAELAKLQCVICFDGYLTPASASGQHCLGASHLRDNAERHFSVAEHQQNFAKLEQNLTACDWASRLDGADLQGKVGIRAAFRDRIPMVGSVPNFAAQKQQYQGLYNQLRRQQAVPIAENFPQLYLIAGLGSRGLTTSPLLAELLASQIAQVPLPLSQDLRHALSPNRSWLRQLLRGRKVE